MVRQPAEAGEVQRGQSRERKRGSRLTFDAGLSHKDLLPLRGFPRCTPYTARRRRLVGGNFRACVHALRTGTDIFPALPFRPPTQNYDTTYVGLLVRPAISRASLTQSLGKARGHACQVDFARQTDCSLFPSFLPRRSKILKLTASFRLHCATRIALKGCRVSQMTPGKRGGEGRKCSHAV